MAVSNKVKGFMEQGSWIRKMFEEGISLKQQFGEENVFDLSLGNPIMEPPQEFFDELRRVAENPIAGLHRYMPNAGFVETRDAVATQLREETGQDFTANEIIMCWGGGGALNVILNTLLDPGDEVFISVFNHTQRMVVPWTIGPRQLRNRLEDVRPYGGTSLYDAMMSALPLFNTREHQRAAVVLISDGSDTGSEADVRDVEIYRRGADTSSERARSSLNR